MKPTTGRIYQSGRRVAAVVRILNSPGKKTFFWDVCDFRANYFLSNPTLD
jgi:hypothetical protein